MMDVMTGSARTTSISTSPALRIASSANGQYLISKYQRKTRVDRTPHRRTAAPPHRQLTQILHPLNLIRWERSIVRAGPNDMSQTLLYDKREGTTGTAATTSPKRPGEE
jgi:hypothetical protein